jgi:hypothetical protein
MKKEFPFGRTPPDTVAQKFTNRDYAYLCRDIMQRMTGEECDVVPRGPTCWYLLRWAGEKWIRA